MSSVPGWGSWSFNPVVILALLAARGCCTCVHTAARELAIGRARAGPLGALWGGPLRDRAGAPLADRRDRRPLAALGAHGPARAALGHRAGAAGAGTARAAAAAGPLAADPAGGRAGQPHASIARAREGDLAVACDPPVGDRDLGVGPPGVFDYASPAPGRACVRARDPVLHRPCAVVADRRPAAAGTSSPAWRAPGAAGLLAAGERGGVPAADLADDNEYPLYASAPRAFGISAINDQHLAGAGMCFVELLVFGIAFAAVFINMLGRSDARVASGRTRLWRHLT